MQNYDEELDCIFSKGSNKNKQKYYNISAAQTRKRILIIKIDDIGEVLANLRNSAMTNQDYEQWCYDNNFTDEYPVSHLYYQASLNKYIWYLAYLTEIF